MHIRNCNIGTWGLFRVVEQRWTIVCGARRCIDFGCGRHGRTFDSRRGRQCGFADHVVCNIDQRRKLDGRGRHHGERRNSIDVYRNGCDERW